VVVHGLQPAPRAWLSIVSEKISALCLEPFVEVPCRFHASLSASDNCPDAALRPIDMLDSLRDGQRELCRLNLEVTSSSLQLRHWILQRVGAL